MLAGYRAGIFAMSYWGVAYQWWAPDPRGVLPLDDLRVTRSLRKSLRRYHVTFDTDFRSVVSRCAEPGREGAWIDEGLERGYLELYRRGLAHSVETRDAQGQLVGGLFGVNVGGLFAGESMFHTQADASKVALVALVERLRACARPVVLDTQWRTEHLASLGVVDIPRDQYRRLLAAVVDEPSLL